MRERQIKAVVVIRRIVTVNRKGVLRALSLIAVTVGLASCVASEHPLLSDAKPVLGRQFSAQVYRRFLDGKASEAVTASFRWNDGAYVREGSAPTTVARFVSVPLQGDDSIIEGTYAGGKFFTYWLGRKLMDGAYLIVPLDEANVDAGTRSLLCTRSQIGGFCIVRSLGDLTTVARATAEAPIKDGEVAIIVEDGLAESLSAPATR